MPSYRLDNKSWIPVVMQDGSIDELSLLAVLRQPDHLQRVGGTPLEAAVIIRLLLAIAHSVRTPEDEFGWLDLWNARSNFLHEMALYVEERGALFDLYDAEKPFAQTAYLQPRTASTATIVYERAQGNNPLFHDHSRVSAAQPITSAQAARALLVTHAFAGSGTGGNNPLNEGKKDQMLAGPLCARLIAVVESGSSLAETILLNLGSNLRAGSPCWQRPDVAAPTQTPSEGAADLYTRNTRAIRLTPNGDGTMCVGVAVFQGEAVPVADDSPADPMIPRYLAKDKKFKALRLSPDRSLWQSADVLLAGSQTETAHPIRALEQLSPLASSGLIAPDTPISLRILGVAANAQGPVTSLWRDECLPFGLSIIADEQRYANLTAAVMSATKEADRTRRRIYSFATNYLQGATESKPDSDVAARVADELSPDLADFWSTIAPDGERIALDNFDENRWAELLRKASDDAFRKAVDRLPPDARRFRAEFARRDTSDKKQKQGSSK